MRESDTYLLENAAHLTPSLRSVALAQVLPLHTEAEPFGRHLHLQRLVIGVLHVHIVDDHTTRVYEREAADAWPEVLAGVLLLELLELDVQGEWLLLVAGSLVVRRSARGAAPRERLLQEDELASTLR